VRRTKLASILAAFVAMFGMATLFNGCSKPAPQTPAPAAAPNAAVADTGPVTRATMPAATPLAGLAGQHIVVLPVHYIRGDTLGFATQITDPRGTLAALDSAIERELEARGVGAGWTFPPALARSAKRNAGYVSNPYSLAAERLRTGVRMSDERLAEPFASQIRAIVAVTDARYAIFPVELRFERLADGRMLPLLHVVLLDARGSSVRWAGDVRGAASASITPATVESLAFALADLVVAP
jgi:hypothetical protein